MVAVALALTAGGLVGGAANADNPSTAELQIELLTNRQQLNSLYSQAAAANERVNGAVYDLEVAKTAMKKHQASLDRAKKAFDAQRAVVAEMTVEQQLNGSTSQAMLSLLDGGSSSQILEEASSLKAIDEAMTAEMDRLAAGQTVLDVASKAVDKVVQKRRAALATRKSARAQIDAAIARAESLERTMSADRAHLVEQLAEDQGKSVEEVDRELTEIEDQVDAGGPLPPVIQPTTPTPKPTTPRPTTPAPTTPEPTKTPEAPKPDPTPEPPPASGSAVEKAIAFAQDQLGEKYSWGGAGPSSWDCSGLTMRAWQAAGINLPHYAPAQYKATKRINVSDMRRGDLLFWSNGSVNSIYHVAMYLGNGKMIHAPRPGRTVEIVSVSYWIKPDMATRVG